MKGICWIEIEFLLTFRGLVIKFAADKFKFLTYLISTLFIYQANKYLKAPVKRFLMRITPEKVNAMMLFFNNSIHSGHWTWLVIIIFCYQNCSDLLWEKNVLVIEKLFWNSRLKAENLQNFWDHEQFIQAVKAQNNFW